MKPAATTFSEWLRRFAHWFFTVSPDAIDPLPPPRPKRGSAKGRRQEPPRLRAQHAGRIHVSDRKPS